MYLRRKQDKALLEWKQREGHLPLIIRGARQIGKTETIRQFAAAQYESVIEINFYEEPKYKQITADGYAAGDILRNITLLDPSKKLLPGKTLLFFDELTEYPEIATSLKFFKEDGRYDVICSGSLLGMQYQRIESNSVGNKEDQDMRSMDFEEFLWAKGYGEDVIDDILRHMLEERPFNTAEMETYSRLFLDYSILGGMPAVLASYVGTGTFSGTLGIQRQLLRDYEEDIRKYLTGLEQTRVMQVYRQIPVQLARENKKFQITRVVSGARSRDYSGCVDWLQDAGIINVCRALHYPELPLGGNYEENKFKLYFADTGLLVASLDEEAQDDLRTNRNLGVYKGALYENFIGEALVKQGYPLYYYKKENSTLEEDFFVRTASHLIPVEVKARDGRSKSLTSLIESEAYPDIAYGIKFSAQNIGNRNGIRSFPHFCAFLLKRYLAEAE